MIELDAKAFNDYLEHEGLVDTIKEREENGSLDKDAKENYSKHVKPLLQVSDKRTKGFNTVFGYPVELLLLATPII